MNLFDTSIFLLIMVIIMRTKCKKQIAFERNGSGASIDYFLALFNHGTSMFEPICALASDKKLFHQALFLPP